MNGCLLIDPAFTARCNVVAGGGGGDRLTLITAAVLRTPRNNYSTECAGYQFRVGSRSITVRSLARWKIAGNNQSHLVRLWTNGGIILGGVTVDMAGGITEGWVYADLATPIPLIAEGYYWIGSTEVSGLDAFYDYDNTLTPSADVTITQGMYAVDSFYGGSNTGYGPPNLQYTLT